MPALYVVWIGLGVVMAAVLYEPAFAVVATWFVRRRDRALTILLRVDGEVHPRVASALVQRGALREVVGRTPEAVADLERAIKVFEQLQLEPGHLGGAKWALGKTLWKRDRVRSKALITEAIALFDKASDAWAMSKADAQEFLRTAR